MLFLNEMIKWGIILGLFVCKEKKEGYKCVFYIWCLLIFLYVNNVSL